LDEVGAAFDGSAGAKRPGWPVDPYRIRRALRNGKLWVIAAGVLGLVCGLLWVKVFMGRAYETVVLLKYEGGLRLERYEFSTGHGLAPAAEALHRESVLSRIRDRSGMDWSLDALVSQIEYRFDPRGGDTLELRIRGETPEASTELAHLVTDVFLTYHRERQARRIEEEISTLASRLEAAQREGQEARQQYNAFRERHGIANLSSEQESTVTSAAQLRADIEFAAAEAQGLEARIASLEEQLAKTPKTSMVGGGVSAEQEAYNQARRELISARASLSADHPRVMALEQQVAELRLQARAGGGGDTMFGSNATYAALSDELRQAKSELTMLLARQKTAALMADKAQERMDSFSGVAGQAATLLTDVEISEALIAHLHATEAALEDALEHPPSGFSVLDPGTVPELPIANKKKPIVFGAISFLFLLCGLSFVLWREFGTLRVQTPAEIAFWGSGPVLAATAWPDDRLGLEELIAGLDDLAPEARGTLLILAGTPNDAPLAMDLARRMNEDWFAEGPAAAAPPVSASFVEKRTPITTPPPPSGPYPVGGAPKQAAARARPSTALALRPVQLVRREQRIRLEAWDGPFEGQALRRAARLADRVVVLVRSDGMSALALGQTHRRIGRKEGVGYIVVALPSELVTLPDRVGRVVEFWTA